MKLYTHEELLEEEFGPRGTAEREAFENAVEAYVLGDAVKRARIEKNISQEELSVLAGVSKAQVSRFEKGKDTTLSVISKLLNALQIKANLTFDNGLAVSII